MSSALYVAPEVAAALAENRPVVALESTVLAHGLPFPDNLETARAMEAAVRAGGAVPATIGIVKGRLVAGMEARDLELFAEEGAAIRKVSTRDFGAVLAAGGDGATTVAGTLVGARIAGIRIFATGGIGGVHRDGEVTLDISADLDALARNPVAVVSAGAKSILDLPRTLEVLESLGVPVVGIGTEDFPAFFTRSSGLKLVSSVADARQAAALLRAHWGLGLESGVLLANPIPAEAALSEPEVEAWIARVLGEARAEGIHGKAVTPWVLGRLHDLSGGRTLAANRSLLLHNAAAAAEIASALAQLEASSQ
jgi:pseudouridine-5'-phosphate glycosidase